MSLKRILLFSGLTVFLMLTVISGFLAKNIWAFNGTVSGDVCLKQEFMTTRFNLVNCSNGKIIISGVNGWIVENGLIYGSFNLDRYFGFELKSNTASTFTSLREMNNYLAEKSLNSYDMNREENVYHLRYGGGRNRKY